MQKIFLLVILGLLLLGSLSCNEANAGGMFGKRPVLKGAYQKNDGGAMAGGQEGDPHNNARRRGDTDASAAQPAAGGSSGGGGSDCGTGG